MSVTKRMRILKMIKLDDFAEKDTKRIRILKIVELAEFAFAEQNTIRMHTPKYIDFEFCCSAE